MGRKQGVGKSHSELVHFWKLGFLVRLGESVTEGALRQRLFLEEIKELCPGCWRSSAWMVTVTGGGPRKKLGSELKPLKMTGNDSEAGWEQVTGTKRATWEWGGYRDTNCPDPLCSASVGEEQVSCVCSRGVQLRHEGSEGKVLCLVGVADSRSSVSPWRVAQCKEEGRPLSSL